MLLVAGVVVFLCGCFGRVVSSLLYLAVLSTVVLACWMYVVSRCAVVLN